jgi:ferritin-like metal-binding protein YciE
MSNDFVKRMRDTGEGDIYLAPTSTKKMLDEAADRIDALNAALEAYATETMERIDELEAALRRLAETDLTGIARAALEGKDER